MFKEIREATISIQAPKEEKVSKDLPVFYNPVMKTNRDISILLLRAIDNTDMQICDPMAGTGIRAIRFLKELPKSKIKTIVINDSDPKATELITKNINENYHDLQEQAGTEIIITNTDANIMLLQSTGFDYIDIDPFGTPNRFLDSAVKRLAREGILAVTATDTSALAGTFPKACRRKYWAEPDRGPLKHEIGLRILIRKCQLIAAQYDKALIPIYSYSKDHYMRVFFRCIKGKAHVDEIVKQHGTHNDAGPLWLGTLWDVDLAAKMYNLIAKLDYDIDSKLIKTIRDESQIGSVGFHDIHYLCKQNKLEVIKFDKVYEALTKKKLPFSRTHFSDTGIRCDCSEKIIVNILKKG